LEILEVIVGISMETTKKGGFAILYLKGMINFDSILNDSFTKLRIKLLKIGLDSGSSLE